MLVRSGVLRLREFARAFSAQAKGKSSGSNGRGIKLASAALVTGLGGAWISLDDSAAALGVRRSIVFWGQAFPIYLHYRVTEEMVKNKSDEEQEKAYNALHDRWAETGVALCVQLGGYFFKAAQIVSTRDEFVPPQYMVHLKKLQDAAPPQRSAEEVKQIIEQDLGAPLHSVFKEFEDIAIGAASVGQVHKARLVSGEEVAIKVMAPRVEDLFRSDIKIIKSFCGLAMPHHLPALREIEKQFKSEFDFELEARNMDEIASALNSHPRWKKEVFVPKPFTKLCSRHVLVMEYVPGIKMIDGIRQSFQAIAEKQGKSLEELEDEEKQQIRTHGLQKASKHKAKLRLLRFYSRTRDLVLNSFRVIYNITGGWIFGFKSMEWTPLPPNLAELIELLLEVHGYQIFQLGCFNGDPHPGNVLLMPDGRLGLIDFGCSIRMTLEDRLKMAQLFIALSEDRQEDVYLIYHKTMGVRTRNNVPDIHYKMAAFWFDRDTPDITGTMNVHHFTEWLHTQDPVVHLPDEYVMAGRVSVLLRAVGAAFGIRLSTAQPWRKYAEQLLRDHSLWPTPVLTPQLEV